jgi:cellulose synthase/poly-beta-1,6-N-acetylglucosamine synthase-like glycosyltransferase
MLEWIFWLSIALVVYAYAGYPVVMALVARLRPAPAPPRPARRDPEASLPGISMVVPVHNERPVIDAKLENTRALQYPRARLQVVFVSDGSTDGTDDVIRAQADDSIELVVLPGRQGKAAALNAGIAHARHEIVVFTDAAIALAPDALLALARPFADAAVGCVSGEDLIEQAGGEGMYGRYELFIRRQEGRVNSIVGASGSLYAQRRELCTPFVPGYAPDFLSVLRTVEKGRRAVSEPAARGNMKAVTDPRDEFGRKVRTVLRGITTLLGHAHMLNPLAFGWFSFSLLSHKIARWLVPFFLAAALASSALLAPGSPFYAAATLAQLVLYLFAIFGYTGPQALARSLPARIATYFVAANLATACAWFKYVAGVRQEIWAPSRR